MLDWTRLCGGALVRATETARHSQQQFEQRLQIAVVL